MIRYNANDPEIYGKKHFDILFNFGLFCLLYAACTLALQGWPLYKIFMEANRPLFHSGNTHMWVLQIMQLSWSLFWLSLGIGILRPRGISQIVLMWVCKYFFRIYGSLFAYSLSLRIYNEYLGFDIKWYPFPIYFIVYALANGVLVLYLIINIRRLVQEKAATSSVYVHNDVSPFPDEIATPRYITLFEHWDPLSAYGKLLMLYGLLLFLPVIHLCLGWLWLPAMSMPPETLDNITKETLYGGARGFGYAMLLSVCGYGLMRQKEWGRMFGIVIHVFIVVVALARGILYLWSPVEPGENQLEMMLATFADIFPTIIFSYVVCRALCHPVVKYVCLRGGHDIE